MVVERRGDVPTLPKGPKTHTPAPVAIGSGSGGKTTKPKGGGKTAKPKDPYAAAQARADAKEKKADQEAAARYLQDAATLAAQIKAQKYALGKNGFIKALNTKLANIDLEQAQQRQLLGERFRDQYKDLQETSLNNEKAADSQSYNALANKARERANATSEAMNQGAGESDLLQTQQMSLRSWNANQSEINRAFYDTRQSINQGITDLNWDIKTGLANNAIEHNTERGKAYENYWTQKGATLTNIGNTYGQQSEYYTLANEAVGSKKTRKKYRDTKDASADAFLDAGKLTGKAYKNPGVSDELMNWEGGKRMEGRLNNSGLGASSATTINKKPEGSTLRSWS